MPTLTVAYRDLGLGELRPFLVLTVTGPSGTKGPIAGLIDSGADGTVLPAGYASLMGYASGDLNAEQGTQVGGSVTMLQATKPAHAFVPELAEVVFDLHPCFVHGCQTPLWGRKDLMAHFDITIMERRQQFSLRTDEPDTN
jgi:hypothetical protein